MKFEVRSRWTGAVKFTAKIDCGEDTSYGVKLGLAVKWAVKTRADLTGADLTGAVLTGAVLTDADLTGADLTRADLTGAVLTGAVLTGADLTRADLTGAVLTGAVLTRAVLTRAVLTDADLTGAVLTDADLTRADLTRAVLTRADLRPIRADLFDVLLRAIPEVPDLLAALRAGRINGATYEGACACLAGTIAKSRHVTVADLGFSDSARPAERWFLAIREGDTPDNHAVARITETWIVEFMGLVGSKMEAA